MDILTKIKITLALLLISLIIGFVLRYNYLDGKVRELQAESNELQSRLIQKEKSLDAIQTHIKNLSQNTKVHDKNKQKIQGLNDENIKDVFNDIIIDKPQR